MKSKTSYLLILCFFTAGCETLREMIGLSFRSPEVEVKAITVEKFRWSTSNLHADLEVINPNSFAIEIKRLHYTISYDRQPLVEGFYDQMISLESGQKTQIQLPFTVRFQQGLLWVQDFLKGEAIALKWQVKGQIQTFLGSFDLQKEGKKELRLQQ